MGSSVTASERRGSIVVDLSATVDASVAPETLPEHAGVTAATANKPAQLMVRLFVIVLTLQLTVRLFVIVLIPFFVTSD